MRGVMFLRHTKRKKDGKEHRYWSIVENRRVGGGRVVQRPLLYLGEINDSQELAWRKSIAVLEEGTNVPSEQCIWRRHHGRSENWAVKLAGATSGLRQTPFVSPPHSEGFALIQWLAGL